MKSRLSYLLMATGVLAGCKEAPVPAQPNPMMPPAASPPDAPVVSNALDIMTAPAETVLASVDGKTITLGEARAEMEIRFSAMAKQVSPEELAKRRPKMIGAIVDQFVMRTLLLNECDRRGITIDAEEEAKAFDRIREKLPQGKTLEEVMKDSPLGEERMREEVLVGIRINKLLAEVLPKDEEVTEEEIAAFAQKNPDARLPESVSARHILIKTSASDTEEEKAAKRQKLEDVRQKLLNGADFSALAAEVSECPSAQRGGDLGTFRRGQMVKPFEDAAFSQQVGVVGDIVTSSFGYHLILVDKRSEGGELPRDRIIDVIRNRKGREAYDQFLVKLRNQADVQFNPASTNAEPAPE